MATSAATRIPGPRGLPFVGVLPYLPRDPFGFCMRAAAQGDGLVRLGLGPVEAFVVSHPDYVRHILVTNAGNYVKGRIMDGIRLALGNGLFTSDGDAWMRQRRLMQPAFHARQVERMAAITRAVIGEALERWSASAESGQPVEILRATIQLNIRIVLGTLFGTSVDEARSARLLDLTSRVFRGMTERVYTFFLPPWVPTPGARAYRRAIAALDAEIYGMIATRRVGDGSEDDLLGVLLAAKDPDSGEQMDDRQVRDEIFTIFLAGYESTASGVTWALHLLSRHPEVMTRLRAELDRVLGGRLPEYPDLASLTYTRMVVNETFRLYPAFPMYFRSSVAADTVGPYTLPAGAQIIVSPYATHHDPRFWDDPETFDPQRFGPERFDTRARNAYYPFGKGQRMCIGEPMALTIAQLLIATIVHAYHVEVTGAEVQPHYAMTYQPKNGLPVILRPRPRAKGP